MLSRVSLEKLKPRTFKKSQYLLLTWCFQEYRWRPRWCENENITPRAIFLWHVPLENLKPRTFRKANTYCWPGAFESIVGDLVDVEDENIPLRDRWLCHLLLLLSGHAPRHSGATEDLNKIITALFLQICLLFKVKRCGNAFQCCLKIAAIFSAKIFLITRSY